MNKSQKNQLIGESIKYWSIRERPQILKLEGQYCLLEHVDVKKHFEDLYKVYGPDSNIENWTYLPFERFENKDNFNKYLNFMSKSEDPFHYAIIDRRTGKAIGTIALMRINEKDGVLEVGYVIYSEELKKTRIATEAQFLLASYVFDDLGYRRYEWKCDSLNEPSILSALRLGFSYEGTFRQALIYKGRNRDTSWFSIIDKEWKVRKKKLETWLKFDNFDENGRQIKKLR